MRVSSAGWSLGRARLLLFSGAGFTDELRHIAAQDTALQLIDLERLYHGA
jgi:hypothetical protein